MSPEWDASHRVSHASTDNRSEQPRQRLKEVLDRWLADHSSDVTTWRRHLHQHPELSREELATTEFVCMRLREMGLYPRVMPTGVGVLCDVGPSDGPRIGLRADMDALPMQENTGLDFASVHDGVCHACGHDAHTAILLGVASVLSISDDLPVGVRLIFQAAEEVMPGGSLDAIAAGAVEGLAAIYALHVDPKLEVGKVGIRRGAITSASDQVEVKVFSAGGHTSRPHLTGDLVHALGAVIVGTPALLGRRIDPRSGTVMVWGAVSAGNAANAIPQNGRVLGTVRTGNHATWTLLEPLVLQGIESILNPLGVTYEISYRRGVPPVVNDPEAVSVVMNALDDDTLCTTSQSTGGEDFSWYLEHVPGAMARLGVWSGEGTRGDLHQPDLVIDERALAVGVRTLIGVVLASE